jgi:uncharacterized membrane protein YraQ (UPF0718 family)
MNLGMPGIIEPFLLVFHISGKTLLGLLPYILAGIVLGELLRRFLWMDQLNKWCRKASFTAVLFAALMGVVSPLCTYGTVPLILMLARKGFPLPPLLTFLISSSSLNPQLFFITWGGINAELALVRLGTVLLFSLLAGILLNIVPARSILATPRIDGPGTDGGHALASGGKRGFRNSVKAMWHEGIYIGWFILIGCILGAAVEVFVPGEWFSGLFRSRPLWSILAAAIIGVPVYVCGGGAIPLVNSLLLKGLNPGAALAFLTVGQTVRIPPLFALGALVRTRYILLYMGGVVVYAVLIGGIFSVIK